MAPTEILAEQHYITIRKLLEASRFRITLLTGSTPARQRREAQAELAARLAPPGCRHARARAGSDRVPRAGPGGHRRAAPLRRHAAGHAARQGPASGRAGHDRDADPAHAGADDLRRSRRVDHARDAAGPPADHDDRQAGIAARRDLRLRARAGRRAAARRTSSTRWWRSPRRSICKAATEMADHLAQEVFPAYRVALLHGRMKQDAKERVMAAFARGEVRHAGLDDGGRSRRRRGRTRR